MVKMTEPIENEPNASGLIINDPLDQPALQKDKFIKVQPSFWVEVPHLKSKRLYRELDCRKMDDSLSNDPVEVLGEIRIQTHMFYWVLHENDVIYRHAARTFKNSYPSLLTAYTKAKVTGTLPKFDPQSTQVHPKHRIRLTINIPPTTKVGPPRGVPKTIQPKGKSKAIVIEDSSEASDSESASEDEYGEQSDWSGKRERTRKSTQPTRQSNRNVTTTNYREPSLSPAKTRTSARLRRSPGKLEEVEDEDEEETDELEHDSDGTAETAKPEKKRIRGRLSRPAYGNIRLIADLSENESDDDYPLKVHRGACDKCQEPPAHISLNKYYAKLKRKIRGRKVSPNEEEEERLKSLGGWVRCLKCTVGIHWKCLSKAQRDEIMKAAQRRIEEAEKEGLFPRRLETLGAYDTTDFFCGACIQGGICMYCKEVAVVPEESPEPKFATENPLMPETPRTVITSSDNTQDPTAVSSAQTTGTTQASKEEEPSRELLFRCHACKRLAHYAHFPQPDPDEILSTVDLAAHYQKSNSWQCTDCVSFIYQLDKILAWRPYPADATEPSRPNGTPVDHKALLPREYLVKWLDRSYRRVEWVPHMWLLSTSASKLKNFLATGPKVALLDTPSELISTERDATPKEQMMQEDDPNSLIPDSAVGPISAQDSSAEEQGPAGPLPDAERRIPPNWKIVERILDIRIWNPSKRVKKRGGRSKRSNQKRVETNSENEENPEAEEQLAAAYEFGQQPDEKFMETMDEWEVRNAEEVTVEQTSDIIWAYVKWSELGYEDATWDVPPRDSEPGYDEFRQAFERFLQARQVSIAKKSKKDAQDFDNRPRAAFEQKKLALTANPELGQKGKLMDFQLVGVNWLFRNWWKRQPSILADDMGLGKTVQITTFVGYLAQHYDACPVLIVVPNSTITNWLREFASWAPRVVVVPYYGEFKCRDVIRRFELFHDAVHENYTRLKFHVLIATYESASSKEFAALFKSVPRWELMIVDEAQRLKNDTSLLFKRLNELNSIHRVLMTGTPLNNNIRELFNLMNFLDPGNWYDMPALEKEYENITEDKLLKLHEDLKPYFLRRTKADVLKLPPKNEVIVPLSMSSIQKELYKSLLGKNVELIQGLVHPASKVANSASGKLGLRNILMDLRKCLQHPYLVKPELEPRGPELLPAAVHKNLVDASCKLRFLQMMLPKLKARGHRVLLFSQFVIALDIVEDFLRAEGYKFLRLDGTTRQLQRQKDMDAFNEPNSDYFIFMLSTRAGGVGINLWSADTVIIFDPDFNPHQDLQAISRAHRYGQKKSVLVFKLMVKGAAEERIMQTGKKKLALDHLIVQKMDEEEISSDLQSILTFGAKALFDETENNDITYTDVDIEKLILRTEQEGDEIAETNSGFGFAKLWTADKDVLEEIQEDTPQDQDTSFWDTMLAKVNEEQAKAKAAEVTGRGAKRRAATTVKHYVFDVDSPEKNRDKKRERRKSSSVPGDDKPYSDHESSRSSSAHQSFPISDDEHDLITPKMPTLSLPPEMQAGPSTMVMPNKPAKVKRPGRSQKVLDHARKMDKNWIDVDDDDDDEIQCGLCQKSHGPGECFMSQDPLNLVDFRYMILNESTEPLEKRRAAIHAIDSHLASLGLSRLTKGQGNIIAERGLAVPGPSRKRRSSSPSHGLVLKKQKLVKETGDSCLICNGPYHLIKSCPIVKAGPESILAAIQHLSSVPNSQAVINMLKDCLQKTKQPTMMGRY